MDAMEDSGFDSDPKSQKTSQDHPDVVISNGAGVMTPSSDSSAFQAIRKSSSELQRKIERQREANRKAVSSVVDQPTRSKAILSRNRLPVPSKRDLKDSPDFQPLVMIDSESEDEFAMPRLSKQAHREITQQLIKDGYNLDLEPDDEDLDLIPPRPVQERCICCNTQVNCCIQ